MNEPLNSLKVKQLKQLATERGVSIPKSIIEKQELVIFVRKVLTDALRPRKKTNMNAEENLVALLQGCPDFEVRANESEPEPEDASRKRKRNQGERDEKPKKKARLEDETGKKQSKTKKANSNDDIDIDDADKAPETTSKDEIMESNDTYDDPREIFSDLTCSLCLNLFYEPATLLCGHTFCRECARRSFVYAMKCPMCRAVVYNTELKINTSLQAVCQKLFPKQYICGYQKSFAEPDTKTLSIFVFMPMLPKQLMHLHIFEPRYRLLITRSLESDLKFGIQTNRCNYGVEVLIDKYDLLPDGRSHVSVKAGRRYKILKDLPRPDGFKVSEVKFVSDVPCSEEDFNELKERSNSLVDEWLPFVRRRERNIDQIIRSLGAKPNEPEAFSFWIAAAINPLPSINLCRNIRDEALSFQNSLDRLRLCNETIEQSIMLMRRQEQRVHQMPQEPQQQQSFI